MHVHCCSKGCFFYIGALMSSCEQIFLQRASKFWRGKVVLIRQKSVFLLGLPCISSGLDKDQRWANSGRKTVPRLGVLFQVCVYINVSVFMNMCLGILLGVKNRAARGYEIKICAAVLGWFWTFPFVLLLNNTCIGTKLNSGYGGRRLHCMRRFIGSQEMCTPFLAFLFTCMIWASPFTSLSPCFGFLSV